MTKSVEEEKTQTSVRVEEEDVEAQKGFQEEKTEIDGPQIDLKVMTRKVDFHLLPLLFLTYSFQFMDKIALGSSSIYGLRTDNHLEGQEYSWVSSIFYFGFMGFQPIAARLIQLVPPGKFLATSVLLWGLVLLCSLSTSSYAGQLVVRFLLGILESATSPICMYYSAAFYTRQQQPSRVAIWFSGNDFAGIVSSFIAFGLGHIKSHLQPWRYIAIVYGSLTMVYSLALFFFLPDSPQSSKFLTEDEKSYYRIFRSQSNIEKKWSWDIFIECIVDVKTWLYVALVILNILPNGGIISFGNIIVENFGFTNIETTLLNVPTSVVTWLSILISGILASKLPNSRCWIIVSTVILPIVGAALVFRLKGRGVRFFGYLLLSIQPATFPNVLALVTSNVQSTQKRTSTSAIIFIIYCAANIAAPQLFRSSESPSYPTAFKTWFICFGLTILFAILTRYYLIFRNHEKEGKIDNEDNEGETSIEDDPTDLKDPHFLYSY